MGSLAVACNGILHTPPYIRLTLSSPSFPVRSLDSPPFFMPGHSDDGILPTPHFSTRLLCPSSLRCSGSFPRRSGLPQKASSMPVSRSTPSTLGVHPVSFSLLPFPPLSPFSHHQPASLPFPYSLLPSLPALLTSLHSLLLHLCQVAQ